jgi:hypothetical protein
MFFQKFIDGSCEGSLNKTYNDPATLTLSTVLQGVGAVASVAGTIQSGKASKKAAAARQRSLEAQRKIAEVKNARERRNAVREARIKRAQALSVGTQQGAGGSSGLTGATSSIGSQLGSGLSFLDTSKSLSNEANIFSQASAGYSSEANTWAGIAGLGSTIFDISGKFK